MISRKVFLVFLTGIIINISVFGQDVKAVKEFERARRTIPVSISLNIFGFGIGSFTQGDYKSAFIQLGVSTIGYAFLLPGIFVPVEKTNKNSFKNEGTKNALIGIGSTLIAGNAIFGTIRPTLYQFDKKFDTFYDINNDAKWPGGF